MESKLDEKSEQNSAGTESFGSTCTANDRVASAASSSTTSNGPSGNEEAFQVVVRVRPPLGREITEGQAVEVLDEKSIKLLTDKHEVKCSYDKILGTASSQGDLYETIAPRVRAVLSGMNSTIFAYGQTGSGKTFSMLGKDLERQLVNGTPISETETDDWGVIPRAIVDLFACINDDKELNSENDAKDSLTGGAVVHCSYMQIYNNKLYDLLADPTRSNKLQIRESTSTRNSNSEIFVQGLSEYRVSSASDVLLLLQHGSRNRAVRATQYNEQSSRSHAILQMTFETTLTKSNGGRIVRVAKLNCVDLAGSEKWNTRVNMKKKHQKELMEINTSLSALGICIQRLTNPNRMHVPYRDSALTRLLEDSLGGNTKTSIIATVAPTTKSSEHTLSTLQFADRARQVMVRVKPNQIVDNKQKLISAEREIARLKNAIEGLRSQLKSVGVEPASFEEALLRQENQQLKYENNQLRTELENMSDGVVGHSRKQKRRFGKSKKSKKKVKKKQRGPWKKAAYRDENTSSIDTNFNANSDSFYNVHGEISTRPPLVSRIPRLPQVDNSSAANLIEVQSARSVTKENSGANSEVGKKGLRHDQVGIVDSGSVANLEESKDIGLSEMNLSKKSEEDSDYYSSDSDSLLSEKGKHNQMPGIGVLARRLDQHLLEMPNAALDSDNEKTLRITETSGLTSPTLDVPESNTPLPKTPTYILHNMLIDNPTLAKKKGEAKAPNQVTANDVRLNKHENHPYAQTHKAFSSESTEHQSRKRGKKKRNKRRSNYERGSNGYTLKQALPEELDVLHKQMMQDVGKRLRIYFARYDDWYKGTVVGIDAERKMHCIEYDHGERRWCKMEMRKYQILKKKTK